MPCGCTQGYAMKCPHCAVSIHENWYANEQWRHQSPPTGNSTKTNFMVWAMQCPECRKEILLLEGLGNSKFRRLIYPIGSSRGPISQDVSSTIAADYNEAASVLPISAKASAALSRRCLQAVLRQAGYHQHDLAKQIEAVLAEPDARKALPTGPHNTLDAIRNFGNFSAHPITDQTTLQVIDVEDHEAEYCLDILDALFDHYYVKPEEAKRRRAALDAKLHAAGKPPSKQ